MPPTRPPGCWLFCSSSFGGGGGGGGGSGIACDPVRLSVLVPYPPFPFYALPHSERLFKLQGLADAVKQGLDWFRKTSSHRGGEQCGDGAVGDLQKQTLLARDKMQVT